jgi:hypothetical protein
VVQLEQEVVESPGLSDDTSGSEGLPGGNDSESDNDGDKEESKKAEEKIKTERNKSI